MSYHHGNLRAALIETAAQLARSKGADGVVLREVARQTGVSHNAAYRHFADREELMTAVADQAMAGLAAAMRRRMSAVDVPDPRERAVLLLSEVGHAYVEFALAEPGLFEIAFAVYSVDPSAPAEIEPAADPSSTSDDLGPYDLLGQVLDDLVTVGLLTPERRDPAQILCWSTVHGFSVLHLRGPLYGVPATEREQSLTAMLALVLRGLVGDLD
ncbi:MAG: TetR/AcrR family transcriptional regulator [Propionibacteriales bacterium]|nr:TetR/AcrR family transcriptional regulator [Propionibacteriales bacterium]